jgi:hypothetical protein
MLRRRLRLWVLCITRHRDANGVNSGGRHRMRHRADETLLLSGKGEGVRHRGLEHVRLEEIAGTLASPHPALRRGQRARHCIRVDPS